MPRNCVNSPDNFCYICGEVTFSTRKHPLTPVVQKAYECCFGCKVRDQDKEWAHHACCVSCATDLREWLNNKGCSMPCALPMIWREPSDHLTDCYFCMVLPLWHRMQWLATCCGTLWKSKVVYGNTCSIVTCAQCAIAHGRHIQAVMISGGHLHLGHSLLNTCFVLWVSRI
jgi:hypothetical protein